MTTEAEEFEFRRRHEQESASTAPEGISDSVITQQEMPEDVSAYHRFVAKNFSNSPDSTIKYLQERYPQYEISHDKGNILFKKPGENTYKVLDPKGITGIGEGLMDLTDIGTDVGAGAASTAASAAAGLAAAPTVVGALPAAMAAGGTTSAGLEALRQKIGSYLGIPQEVSGKDVAISGALGAAAPLLFGTGASAAQIAAKSAEKGLTETGAEALAKSQKGVITRSLSGIYSKASGIPKKVVETAGDNMDKIKTLEKAENPTTELAKSLTDDVSKLEKAHNKVGSEIGDAVQSHPDPIDLTSAKDPYLKKISELEGIRRREGLTPALKEDLQSAKSEYKRLFGEKIAEAPKSQIDPITLEKIAPSVEAMTEEPATSAEKAFLIKRKLTEAANLGIAHKGPTSDLTESLARQGGGALSSEFATSIPKLEKLNPIYEAGSRVLDFIRPKTKTESSAYNLVKNLKNKSKEVDAETLNMLDKTVGTKFIDKANLIDAFQTFRKTRPFELGWSTIKQRAPAELAGAAGGAYLGYKSGGGYQGGLTGGLAGGALGAGAGSPTAIRGMLNLGNIGSKLTPYTRKAVLPIWDALHSRFEQNKK